MTQSQLNLFNLSLGIVGADYTVTDVNESSVPAATCLMFYDLVRQVALRGAHWASGRQFSRLTPVSNNVAGADWAAGFPEPGYAFSYALPVSSLAARYLTTWEEFALSYDTTHTKMILSCNIGQIESDGVTVDPAFAPVLAYSIDVSDPSRWEPDLYMAIAYALASHIAMPLTGKRSRANDTINMANQIILSARAATANERQRMLMARPESLAVRGYNFSTPAPFIYPYGAMYAASGAPLSNA